MLPSEWYEKYSKDRKIYESRAERFSDLTIPYAIVKDGSNESSSLSWSRSQGFCGGLVSTLKSKIGLALLPASTSSFRFSPDSDTLQKIYGENQSGKEELFAELSLQTQTINNEIEAQQIRGTLFQAIEQLLVVGSVIIEKEEDDGVVVHGLKSFSVKLNRKGQPLGICIYERLYELPEGVSPKEEKDEYELYTLCLKDVETKQWIVTQEVEGELVGTEETYKTDMDLPYRYLGWHWQTGEKYHRPYVETHYDTMEQLNMLAELLTRGALASAKVNWMVDERGGRTSKKELESSLTGDYLHGKAEDVTAVQLGKNYDFQVPMEREASLKKELAKAFLSNEAAARDSERTTAYEVRLMAQEIESSTMGGIYSAMSIGFNQWLVHQVMGELGIKFNTIGVDIITGLDALGRSQEAQKLDGFVQRLAQLELVNYVKSPELITRYASYDGITTAGLIKTSEEVAAETKAAQQQQQQAMAQESMAGATGGIIQDAAKQQPQQG